MLDLEKAKVSDLRAKCRTVRRGSARQANPLLGITHYSKLSKADLQQLILACTSDKPPAFGHPISVVSPGSAQGIQAEHEFTLTLNQCQTSDNKYSSNSVNPSKGKKSQIAAVLPPKPYCSTDTTSKRPNTIVSREHPNVTLRRPSPTRQQKRRRISIPTVHRSEPQTQLPDASCEPHQAVVDLATKAGRTEWIKSLFIERIFAMLDKNRSLPLIQHGMHFRGVDPLFFESDCSIEAFLTAVRFCIARVHCFMALGAGQGWSSAAFSELGLDFVKWPIVNRVQRLNGQFWLIETTGANTKRYLCLGLTGEVLGMSGAQSGAAVIEDVYAREDWVRFIGRQRDTSEPLHCLIKTKDPHANPGGISRGWREKSNDLEVEIAKRVVLTSCYLNSFTGEKLSITAMDNAALGRPAVRENQRMGQLDIYLPEALQVQSIHLMENVELAIAHRASGVSHFVLRETGQVVGDDDGGIAPLWQGLLGCDEKGRPSSSTSFWHEWEERLAP